MYRHVKLINEKTYHICTKSIAGYKIFNNDQEFQRMFALIRYYQLQSIPLRFSHFIETVGVEGFHQRFDAIANSYEKNIRIIAYCLMPTHIHFVIEQIIEDGISRFMANILNSYAKYFNLRHKRRGPLWEGRFKSIFVETDEQLLHLTRYLHLNPVTAGLVRKPEQWTYSSYFEYVRMTDKKMICDYQHLIDIHRIDYKKFVEDQINYQRELAFIKHLMLD